MYLLVRQVGSTERRWYGVPARGILSVGAAAEGDVQIAGHNISARHVRLHFRRLDRVRIEVRSAYGVRVDGAPPRGEPELVRGGVLTIGAWSLTLEASPPSGIEPIDDVFLATLARDPGAFEDRLVYADSLEERGRLAEAELVRAPPVHPADVARLAVRSAPGWRRRFLPIAIESCKAEGCPQRWGALPADDTRPTIRPCGACVRDVELFGTLGAAREQALAGHPVALDPAVRRWPNDLRAPVVKRPLIEMGHPRDR